MTWISLAVFVGAVFRLAWLIAADNITQPVRDWVEHQFGEESKPAYLINCLWCTSIWVCVPLAILSWLFMDGTLWQWACAALTASALTGGIGSPLYKHLNPPPKLSTEQLAAEIHEAIRDAGIPGMAWLDTPHEYRQAMMAATTDLRHRQIVE